ncbi:hypothetical protein ACXH7L_005607, partial [Klebsiella variicola]
SNKYIQPKTSGLSVNEMRHFDLWYVFSDSHSSPAWTDNYPSAAVQAFQDNAAQSSICLQTVSCVIIFHHYPCQFTLPALTDRYYLLTRGG